MRKGARTRQEIVGGALALAGQVGLEGVSLGMLSARLNLSKSGLFAHFRSKEALQLAVLEEAIERFVRLVIRPALAMPRGLPRVRGLAEGYLAWIRAEGRVGGCLFLALSHEYDDRPGPVRDLLVSSQDDWLACIARAAGIAVAEGQFRADLDPRQFAYEFVGITMAFQHANRLMRDPDAERRAMTAFETLFARSR